MLDLQNDSGVSAVETQREAHTGEAGGGGGGGGVVLLFIDIRWPIS